MSVCVCVCVSLAVVFVVVVLFFPEEAHVHPCLPTNRHPKVGPRPLAPSSSLSILDPCILFNLGSRSPPADSLSDHPYIHPPRPSPYILAFAALSSLHTTTHLHHLATNVEQLLNARLYLLILSTSTCSFTLLAILYASALCRTCAISLL